ncbi:hypothetical protein [Consotaella salsifontis]|uniref:hypothetical protein n=1 Tax=Consotaella salsifontis TaxID=1365950 RepID=UPI0010545FBE|nr:hypothetical protein [Consotaella salsifontis]
MQLVLRSVVLPRMFDFVVVMVVHSVTTGGGGGGAGSAITTVALGAGGGGGAGVMMVVVVVCAAAPVAPIATTAMIEAATAADMATELEDRISFSWTFVAHSTASLALRFPA